MRYLTVLCTAAQEAVIAAPDVLMRETLALDVPPMPGVECLGSQTLVSLWVSVGEFAGARGGK